MEAAGEAPAREWKQLYESKRFPYGYWVFKALPGSDLPLHLVSTPARDAADLAALRTLEESSLGAERQALMDRTMALTHNFAVQRYRARPDLSLSPATAGG